jgi:two-component system response regulator HupR/HoxA
METHTVLFVDDEEVVLRSIERGLLEEPFRKLFAVGGEEALEILQEEEIHVIVTDMRMPGMDGLELIQAVKEKYPHIVRIVLSGYAQTSSLMIAIHKEGIFEFVPKPWKLEDFKQVIRKAIDHYENKGQNKEIETESRQCSIPGEY